MIAPSVRSLQTLRNCGCAECKGELAHRLAHDADLYRPATEDDYSQRRLNAQLAGTSMENTDWVARHADHMRKFPHSKATPALLREGATYDGPRLAGHPQECLRSEDRSAAPCPIQQSLEESHIYE